MGNTWKKACKESATIVNEIRKYIPEYSYDSPEISQDTEELMDVFIKEAAVKISDTAHTLLNLSFELHKDDLAEDLRKLGDLTSSLEVFTSDSSDWGRMPILFLKRLLTKDSTIVIGTVQISEDVASLSERFHHALNDKKMLDNEMSGMQELLKDILKSIENLISVLRERENIRDFKEEHMRHALKIVENE